MYHKLYVKKIGFICIVKLQGGDNAQAIKCLMIRRSDAKMQLI